MCKKEFVILSPGLVLRLSRDPFEPVPVFIYDGYGNGFSAAILLQNNIEG